jgi:hypothetical protein
MYKHNTYSEAISKRATAVLNSQVPPKTQAIMHIALKVTAEITADVLEDSKNRQASTREVKKFLLYFQFLIFIHIIYISYVILFRAYVERHS